MERATFDETMTWVQKYYGQQQSEDKLAHFWAIFGETDDGVFTNAVQRLLKNGRFFPTPVELGNAIIEAREEISAKTKRAENRNPNPISRPVIRSELARDSFAIIQRVLDPKRPADKLTAKQLAVEMMTTMELKYPGLGFEENGQGLFSSIETKEENAAYNEKKVSG